MTSLLFLNMRKIQTILLGLLLGHLYWLHFEFFSVYYLIWFCLLPDCLFYFFVSGLLSLIRRYASALVSSLYWSLLILLPLFPLDWVLTASNKHVYVLYILSFYLCIVFTIFSSHYHCLCPFYLAFHVQSY